MEGVASKKEEAGRKVGGSNPSTGKFFLAKSPLNISSFFCIVYKTIMQVWDVVCTIRVRDGNPGTLWIMIQQGSGKKGQGEFWGQSGQLIENIYLSICCDMTENELPPKNICCSCPSAS